MSFSVYLTGLLLVTVGAVAVGAQTTGKLSSHLLSLFDAIFVRKTMTFSNVKTFKI